jgi:hypothetical protein
MKIQPEEQLVLSNGQMDGWMDEWMDKWMHGWIDTEL